MIYNIICFFFDLIHKISTKSFNEYIKHQLGYCGKNVSIQFERGVGDVQRIYLYDNTNIFSGFKFISVNGKFIMKRDSGAAQGLTVITNNHSRIPGIWLKENMKNRAGDYDKDVIVEEEVWIGANVTILSGSLIGRGANIGAGSVIRGKVPPYSIVFGNPARVIGFSFSPEEIIEHEKTLYPEKERYTIDILNKNYEKYFLNRVKENKEFYRI